MEGIEKYVNEILQAFSFKIKYKQLEAIHNLLSGFDTLCLLPTSYGKSLIYQLLPSVFDFFSHHKNKNSLVIVISPLVALITDQVSSAQKMAPLKLAPVALKLDNFMEVLSGEGECNLIFGTPEIWLDARVKECLLGSKYVRENVKCIVVDEAHKVSW